MGRLFGKDGLKGIGVSELRCEIAVQLGQAVSAVLAGDEKEKSCIVVGRDTRSSGVTLEAALCAGISSAGVDVLVLGEVPAPVVSFMVRKKKASAGIMISYSNRKSESNAFKVYSAEGKRIGRETEDEIEKLILDEPWNLSPIQRRRYGKIKHTELANDDYIDYIVSKSRADLSGVRVAVDCGNGAASFTAEKILTRLGADTVMMGNKPSPTNINRECGSTSADALMSFTKDNSCDCGIAFDGAGERCIAVDEKGQLMEGDLITALCAKYLKETGKLKKNTLVVTSANNLGLTNFGIDYYMNVVSAGSDERDLMKLLEKEEYSVAGDPWGYMLIPKESPVADGQIVGIKLLEILKRSEKKMSEITNILKKLPQVMMNIPISRFYSEVWKKDTNITSLISYYEKKLGDSGRIAVREEGKEPVIRVLVEGRDFSEINMIAIDVADRVRQCCGRQEELN